MTRDLTERQIKIIKYLITRSDYVSIEVISALVAASNRTIRRDIEVINTKLYSEGILLASKAGCGIRAQFQDDTAEIKSKSLFLNESDLFNNNIRLLKVASYLLMNSPQHTSISKLSNKYFISRASIVNDLKKLSFWLNDYHLALAKDLSGTRIVGDEKDMRIAMKDLVLKSIYNNTTLLEGRIDNAIQGELAEKFGEQHVLFTTSLIITIEQQLGYCISDPNYINLFTHILVLIHRINLGLLVNELSSSNFKAVDKKAYDISLATIEKIEQRYKINLNKIESEYIYQHLVSSGKTGIDQDNSLKMQIASTGYAHEFTRLLIVRVSELIQVDLTLDNVLTNSLLSHIKPMLNRLEYNICIKNPLLHDITTELGSIFTAVKTVVNSIMLEHNLGVVNDDEIGYLTVHIQAAIENNITKIRVLLVCSSGLGTSQLLYGRVLRAFPGWDIVGIVPGQEIVEYIKRKEVDIIISTIKLVEIKKPVVYVSALFSGKDIIRVTECLVSNYMKYSVAFIRA
jgi:activator of the mannose operon (transcriptional antiterminator)